MEEKIKSDLFQYLLSLGKIDERLPECPDLEEKWQNIAEAYLPDGIREFNNYPISSLGWMMFIGMAMAKYWDEDWEKYASDTNIYEQIRNQRGYDEIDEYVLKDLLHLKGKDDEAMRSLVGECASRTYSLLHHAHLEPGTAEAFKGFISSLHQLYLMGVAIQLKCMGYRMTLID